MNGKFICIILFVKLIVLQIGKIFFKFIIRTWASPQITLAVIRGKFPDSFPFFFAFNTLYTDLHIETVDHAAELF